MFRRRYLAAERAGKWKTVSQMTAISLVLFTLILSRAGILSRWPNDCVQAWQFSVSFLLSLAVAFTIVSGILYLKNNWRALSA
jgi:phosphatidylglycerophosphate synthase